MADAPLVFLDTNVLLYAFDEAYPQKRDRSRAWLTRCWQARCGRLSTQVLNEFYSNARKKFAPTLPSAVARTEVRRYQQWAPWQIDLATVETAWAVEERYQLNYWDALIVAAARHQGCTVLLSEDLQHDQRLEGVRVLNPFIVGPEALDAAT
jgi:predicted nucleic acid-binding protein